MHSFVRLAAMSVVLTTTSLASAVIYPITSLSGPTGTAGTDYNFWKQTGITLGIDNAEPFANIIAGNAAAPGGNVELFANSESGAFSSNTFGGAFQTVTRTSFSGTVNGNPITVSSLNANDLFNTFPGVPVYSTGYLPTPNTIARQWFKDFFDYYDFDGVLSGVGVAAPAIDLEKAALYSAFAAAGQFARISDPNVSYVYLSDTTVHLGLAGSQSYVKTFITNYIAASGNLTLAQKQALLGPTLLVNPNDGLVELMDIQVSELVRVIYNGNTYISYGFNSTPTGLSTADPTESYGRNFDLVIPEPASIALLSLGSLLMFRRAKRG